MKKFIVFTLLTCSLSSCETLEVPCDELVEIDSLKTYQNKAFTGLCVYVNSENGVREYRNYRKGLANGDWTKFYSDSTLAFKGYYNNGKIEGSFESYHANGTLKGSGTLKEGYKVGRWIYYDPEGIVIQDNLYSSEGALIK